MLTDTFDTIAPTRLRVGSEVRAALPDPGPKSHRFSRKVLVRVLEWCLQCFDNQTSIFVNLRIVTHAQWLSQ